jgi:flagellar basal body-associated protein FliL
MTEPIDLGKLDRIRSYLRQVLAAREFNDLESAMALEDLAKEIKIKRVRG